MTSPVGHVVCTVARHGVEAARPGDGPAGCLLDIPLTRPVASRSNTISGATPSGLKAEVETGRRCVPTSPANDSAVEVATN